ncbi:hypothetical protein [Nocardioides sp.]|uniref:hypothetical protein n=1 Tax=Nocardioides sp. TaxID=35761 RepID=UPI0035112E00
MARRSGPAFIQNFDADYAAIEQEYRDLLERTTPPTDLQWEPIKIGPTWQYDDGWLLPDASLGWGFLSWTTRWLTGKGGKPWWWTAEQTRFLLWYYAIDSDADFIYSSAALQRLKGWGKDPTAAGIAAGSLHAPVMFDRWVGDRPIGRDDPEAWTQIAAVAQDQTKNTFKIFPSLIPAATRRRYGIQIGKFSVWSDGDRRQIEGVTANPEAIEGGRPHQIIRAEIQNWLPTNGGHDMVGAMEGNAAKAEASTPARILDIFNAWRPGRDSVAERQREAWESTQGENADQEGYGKLWDSLEAPPEAPLTREAIPSVVRAVAGDATWLDVRPKGRIMQSCMNPENPPSESRRKWFNQVSGTEDAWAQPAWVDDPRNRRTDEELQPGDRIALFGDGSKSGDDTGLIGIRISDGLAQVLHHQHPGKDPKGELILVNRGELDAAVTLAFDTYTVVAFYFDPSHAKDDSAAEDDRFWWPLVDDWHRRYHRRLRKEFWPVKSGPTEHAVAFDMSTTAAQKMHQPAVDQVAEDLKNGEAPFRDSGVLRRHLKNARMREGRFGTVIGKESRSSLRKIDLAVCFVGARMLQRRITLSPKSGTPGKGRVIVRD